MRPAGSRDTVVSARVVLGDGSVGIFDGEGLDMISEAEGITGIITELTIKIQPDEPLEVLSLGCPEAHSLQNLLEGIYGGRSADLVDAFHQPPDGGAEESGAADDAPGPPRREAGRCCLQRTSSPWPSEQAGMRHEVLARDYGRAADRRSARPQLLSDEIAHHEWEHRFQIMTVKRLGPSLVPAEVVVPLSGLGAMMTEVEQKVEKPVVKEGVLIRQGRNRYGRAGGRDPRLHPGDQRKFTYNFVFPLSLTISTHR